MTNAWLPDKGAVGAYIRSQRELANLSLRELSRMSQVSNAYLSQVERGLHEPSLRVMSAVADALAVPLQDLVSRTQQGVDAAEKAPAKQPDVEGAIRSETRLSSSQQEALIAVYRSYLAVSAASSVLKDPAPRRRRKGDA